MSQPKPKPRLFIGSSREAIRYGNAIHSALSRVAQVLPWYNGTFQGNEYTMESLEKRLKQSDFAVFVFAADDVAMIRGKHVFITRDNTLFEAGLFWGKLGRLRVFCLIPAEVETSDGNHIQGVNIEQHHLLSDLSGITLLQYEYAHNDEYEAAVSVACTKIVDIVSTEGFYSDPGVVLRQTKPVVDLFWEYSRLVPIGVDAPLPERHRALAEAIRVSFLPPNFGDHRVTHVALYAKQGTDGMEYVGGNMDEGKFYSFSDNAPTVPVVIQVQRTGNWTFGVVQNIGKRSILCYPLGDNYVVSVVLSGTTTLSGLEQEHTVAENEMLLTAVKHIVGGDPDEGP